MSKTIFLPKAVASILALALILALSYPVLAADSTPSSSTRTDKIEARKANIQERIASVKERIATKEAALKTRLDAFKNKQKAQIAKRINTNLANINEKITKAMDRHLEVMSGILDKLEARVNANTPDIKDPAAVRSAIAEAKDAIATATAAVDAQAEKDYVLEATSEATIRQDMQGVKEQLRTDLKAVRQLVIDAKQKVANAIRVAKANVKKGSNGQ